MLSQSIGPISPSNGYAARASAMIQMAGQRRATEGESEVGMSPQQREAKPIPVGGLKRESTGGAAAHTEDQEVTEAREVTAALEGGRQEDPGSSSMASLAANI
jgi:hypothetical protein